MIKIDPEAHQPLAEISLISLMAFIHIIFIMSYKDGS
jgi:hypothetical protein